MAEIQTGKTQDERKRPTPAPELEKTTQPRRPLQLRKPDLKEPESKEGNSKKNEEGRVEGTGKTGTRDTERKASANARIQSHTSGRKGGADGEKEIPEDVPRGGITGSETIQSLFGEKKDPKEKQPRHPRKHASRERQKYPRRTPKNSTDYPAATL